MRQPFGKICTVLFLPRNIGCAEHAAERFYQFQIRLLQGRMFGISSKRDFPSLLQRFSRTKCVIERKHKRKILKFRKGTKIFQKRVCRSQCVRHLRLYDRKQPHKAFQLLNTVMHLRAQKHPCKGAKRRNQQKSRYFQHCFHQLYKILVLFRHLFLCPTE